MRENCKSDLRTLFAYGSFVLHLVFISCRLVFFFNFFFSQSGLENGVRLRLYEMHLIILNVSFSSYCGTLGKLFRLTYFIFSLVFDFFFLIHIFSASNVCLKQPSIFFFFFLARDQQKEAMDWLKAVGKTNCFLNAISGLTSSVDI